MISQTDALFIPKNLFLFLQPSRSAMGSPGLSAALAARSVLPSNRPATPLFSPACWEGLPRWD